MSAIKTLLSQTQGILKAKEQLEKSYDPLIAPKFSPISLFHPQETDLSRILADLLDPRGSHAQGTLFLDAFINELRLHPENILPDQDSCGGIGKADIPPMTERTNVSTEFSCESAGRVDILLEDSTKSIVIENKPWASDGKDQLQRYANYLSRKTQNNGQWLIVYLSDSEPGENSIDRQNPSRQHIVQMDFTQLGELLAEAAKQAQAPAVRVFVEAFAKYLLHNIAGKPEMTDPLILSLICRSENIAAAKQLHDAYDNLRQKAWETFCHTLEKLSSERWKNEISVTYHSPQEIWKRNRHIVFQAKNGLTHYGVGFEADGPFFCKLFWGAFIDDPSVRSNELHRKQINKLFNERFEPYGTPNGQLGFYWAWWLWGDDKGDEKNTKLFFPSTFENEKWLSMMLSGEKNLLTDLVLDKVEVIFPPSGNWPTF